MSKIPVKTFDEGKDKEVFCGYIEGDTFYREVKNEHYMIKENGYGEQADVLQKLLKNGVKKIRIKTKNGTLHESDLKDWVLKGKRKKYGHGNQVFLPVEYMRVTKGY